MQVSDSAPLFLSGWGFGGGGEAWGGLEVTHSRSEAGGDGKGWGA